MAGQPQKKPGHPQKRRARHKKSRVRHKTHAHEVLRVLVDHFPSGIKSDGATAQQLLNTTTRDTDIRVVLRMVSMRRCGDVEVDAGNGSR